MFPFVSLALVVAASPAFCGSFMESFLENVDLVVVGEVASGAAADGSYSFTLVPNRVLKGDLKPGVGIPVTYNGTGGVVLKGGGGEFSGDFGLWFLARDKAGQWRLLSASSGQSPLFPYAYYTLSRSARPDSEEGKELSVADRVFREVALALDIAVESAEPGKNFRQSGGGVEIVGPPEKALWHLAGGVLACVGDPASPLVKGALDRWSRSQSPDLRTMGLIGLVRVEGPAGLARARAELPTVESSQLAPIFVEQVLAYRSPDPQGVRILGEMATEKTGVQGLQRAAAQALRAIHTRESLPYLAKLLDSQDSETREHAVAGFTFFALSLPVMTPAVVVSRAWGTPTGETPYRTSEMDRYLHSGRFEHPEDEQPTIQFWKGWWETHRVELTQPQP